MQAYMLRQRGKLLELLRVKNKKTVSVVNFNLDRQVFKWEWYISEEARFEIEKVCATKAMQLNLKHYVRLNGVSFFHALEQDW